jgi:hypothetical protein
MNRFWSKVDKTDSCWIWVACKYKDGYGRFRLNGRCHRAHRVAYELLVGPIPPGLVLDHLCRNRACVNPSHLDPVTHQTNIARGHAPMLSRLRARDVTECRRGHEFTPENTYTAPRGHRECRKCRRAAVRRYHYSKKRTA